MKSINSLNSLAKLDLNNKSFSYYSLPIAAQKIGFDLRRMPYSMRVLLENSLRHEDGKAINVKTFDSFKNWLESKKSEDELEFMPARVLMQDFTGVPAVVDLAAMRDAMAKLGGDPKKINPLIPVDLVIDHSVQIDSYANHHAFDTNVRLEMQRNKERYEFLRWGQKAFDNFRVVPPGTGICHQVNLEYLAKVVWQKTIDNETFIYPDTLVGTDSHTTMVNGLSVLGWGVGGIEAEAAMLGQSLPMVLPEVIGVKLSGKLQEGVTATDLVLTITSLLRKKGVVNKFVEFFGPGLSNLPLADRATIANMAPEYGATCGFFPVDEETLKYLRLTSRSEDEISLVEKYSKAQMLWQEGQDPEYTDVLEVNLQEIVPSVAGPKRPQDRLSVDSIAHNFSKELPNLSNGDSEIEKECEVKNKNYKIGHGSVVIAAITSCTNTSNPSVMVAAGLVAKKAFEFGIVRKPWVKTSLAPGSKVVTEYLQKEGLNKYLDYVGFNLTGYGCTTCIGNSGPLDPEIEESIINNKLVVTSVLSGNRNFEGRIHPNVRANYLASPPLVVLYALAGTINLDITRDPITTNPDGIKIYLRDLWPTEAEIKETIGKSINPEIFKSKYMEVFDGDDSWKSLPLKESFTYEWDPVSTYINNPPYFDGMTKSLNTLSDIRGAKLLAMFGDSITTDHISPAGNISKSTPAGIFLQENNILPQDFNSYGSRRGNHEVMMRGTFANVRIKNELLDGKEGGLTKNWLKSGEEMSIYKACMDYKKASVPTIVIAGKEYGTGSSRDWAAKGTFLLGVKAVIAESFERIHRSNLVGMGVLPLKFKDSENRKTLNLKGDETFDLIGVEKLSPRCEVELVIHTKDQVDRSVKLVVAIDTENEIDTVKNGGILHKVIREIS